MGPDRGDPDVACCYRSCKGIISNFFMSSTISEWRRGRYSWADNEISLEDKHNLLKGADPCVGESGGDPSFCFRSGRCGHGLRYRQ